MKFEQGMIFETFNGFVFRDRLSSTALGDNRHLFAMAWIAPDMRLHATGWRGRFSIYKREVGLLHCSQAQLILQPAMSAFVLRQQNQARGHFLEAMDNTGSL